MILPPSVRKLTLAVHLTLSVGWIGAVAAYMALDFRTATSRDLQALRSAYVAMNTIAGSVIVPLALASLATGIVISLGTKWGLFRHYWVLISLAITIFATVILLVEMSTVRYNARIATLPQTSVDELRRLGSTLLHSIGGTIVLVVVLVLNIYKPRGLTRYGWRKQQRDQAATS